MRWILLLLSCVLYVTVGIAHPFDIDLSKVNVQPESKIKTPDVKKTATEATVNKHGNENNTTNINKNGKVETKLKNDVRVDAKTSERKFNRPQENTTLKNQRKDEFQNNSTTSYKNPQRKNGEDFAAEMKLQENKTLPNKQAMEISSVNNSKENYTNISKEPVQVTTQKAIITDKIIHISILNDAIDLPTIQEEAPIDIPIPRPGTRVSIFHTVKEPHLAGAKLDKEKSESASNEGNKNNSEISIHTVAKLQHKENSTDDNEISKNVKTDENNNEQVSKNIVLIVTPISQGTINISDVEKTPPTKFKFSLSRLGGSNKQQDSIKIGTNKTNLESKGGGDILKKNGVSVVVSADIDHKLKTTEEQDSTEHGNNSTTKDTAESTSKPGSVLKGTLDLTAIEEGEPVDIPIPRPGTQQAIYFNTVVEPKLRDSTLRAIDIVKEDAGHDEIDTKSKTSDVLKEVDTINNEKIENNIIPSSPSPVTAK